MGNVGTVVRAEIMQRRKKRKKRRKGCKQRVGNKDI